MYFFHVIFKLISTKQQNLLTFNSGKEKSGAHTTPSQHKVKLNKFELFVSAGSLTTL